MSGKGHDVAGGASGEESAWRDLIANFTVEPDPAGGAPPWPERENLAVPPQPGPLADPGPDTDPDLMLDLAEDTGPEFDFGSGLDEHGGGAALRGYTGSGPDGGSFPPGALGHPGQGNGGSALPGPRLPGSAGRGPGRHGRPGRGARSSSEPRIIRPASADPPPAADDENFVPPVPPPLPSLDPVAKGAWVALFGGPAYLLIATMAGWSVPGWAAFLAVAAFIGGFTTLVIRMGDRPPRDSGPDDGAVL
ncbi:MAG TPA: hypothetical protein VMH35_16015 [Streptosporangiaceae bacterium]|nr:hypothetical protein [Streptosporangiaceae bacterium]